jgi:O-antigen ligase
LALLAGIGVIIAAYGFVLHEQLSDNPWIATPHPIWTQASAALGIPLKPSVSIVRFEPFYALGAPLALVLALMCGLVVGTDRDYARQALQVMAWSGVAYAVYGIVMLLFAPTTILWREKTAYVGSLTATFINRNSAAAYFGSCAAVWLLLLLQRIRERLPKGPIIWTKIPENILTETHKDILVRFAMFFVCLAAMFMTGSRAGVVVSLLVMIIAFVTFFRRDLPRGKGLVVALVGAGAVALILLQIMGGNVEQRFDVLGLADEGRLATYRSMLRMITDYPWFGTGLGTFAWAFPPYRSATISMGGVWDIGHNTPLEFATELGVPLTTVVSIGWIVAFVILIQGVRRGRHHAIIPLAALTVSLIALLQSLVDFSLQIPGYAIVVFALFGLGLARSLKSHEAMPRHELNKSVDLT